MLVDKKELVKIQLSVNVWVDPEDDDLLVPIRESGGTLSVIDVVRAEVASNLESVSYVRHVNVE